MKKSLIAQALEVNRSAGTAERITIDGITFSRLPLLPDQPVLCVSPGYNEDANDIEVALEKAKKAKQHLEKSGLSWTEIQKRFSASDPIHSNIHGEIWHDYDAHLDLFANTFLHEPNGCSIWSLKNKYINIYPVDADYMLVAKYWPSAEDVSYLEEHGFILRDYINDPQPYCTYFMNVDNWDSTTMSGIIKL